MVVPSWNHVFSRVQATQGGVSNMVAPRWHHVFSRAQATQMGYLTWWFRVGTTCFYVSRPPRGVSNMVLPRWLHVFLRVQATQTGYLTWASWSLPGAWNGTSRFYLYPVSIR